MLVALGVSGCGASAPAPEAAAPQPIAVKPPATYAPERSEALEEICKIDPQACPNLEMEKDAARTFKEPLYAAQQFSERDTGPHITLTGPLAGAPAARKLRSGGMVAQAALPPPPPAAIPVKPVAAARPELFDIEAKVQIEVTDIEKSRKQLTELTRTAGGQVLNEAVEHSDSRRGASLSLRIPTAGVHGFLERLREVGLVRSSTLETTEVSRKIADAEVIVRNLEEVLSRYEALLSKAANVSETIQIESQLTRVRTQLDRVRSDVEWAKDRAARSTVYVTLSLEAEQSPLHLEAKLHPGLRAALFYDVAPSSAPDPSTAYAGGGLSVAWPRRFSMDLDLLTSLREKKADAIDFYIFTLGTDLYSEFMGNGKNTFLNPYIGFRTGFAHAPNQALFPIGGTLGLDIYKTRGVLIAFETRAFALLGRKQGVDFGVEPSLGANVAY